VEAAAGQQRQGETAAQDLPAALAEGAVQFEKRFAHTPKESRSRPDVHGGFTTKAQRTQRKTKTKERIAPL
jgi:hypothetical protein